MDALPVDATLNDSTDLRRLVKVDGIVDDLQQAKTLRVLILDSCRDNPLADELKRALGSSRGASVRNSSSASPPSWDSARESSLPKPRWRRSPAPST